MINFLLGILLLLIFNSLFCVGLHKSAEFYRHDGEVIDDTKNILWYVRYWIEDKLGWYAKPLISCVRCMASFWSFPYWIVALHYADFSPFLVAIYLLYIPALSATNELISDRLL